MGSTGALAIQRHLQVASFPRLECCALSGEPFLELLAVHGFYYNTCVAYNINTSVVIICPQ